MSHWHTISDHCDFHKKVAREYKGRLVVSTGFTERTYEDYVLNLYRENSKLYLLQCTSAYPTPTHDCQVAVVRHYAELKHEYPNVVAGYSSHDSGSEASRLAVAAGAKMIEKHVRLDSVDWVHFDKVAVDLISGEFKKFVSDIRRAEILLGSGRKSIRSSEHHKYWKKKSQAPTLDLEKRA